MKSPRRPSLSVPLVIVRFVALRLGYNFGPSPPQFCRPFRPMRPVIESVQRVRGGGPGEGVDRQQAAPPSGGWLPLRPRPHRLREHLLCIRSFLRWKQFPESALPISTDTQHPGRNVRRIAPPFGRPQLQRVPMCHTKGELVPTAWNVRSRAGRIGPSPTAQLPVGPMLGSEAVGIWCAQQRAEACCMAAVSWIWDRVIHTLLPP